MSIVASVLPRLQGISEGEMLDTVTILRPGAAVSDTLGGRTYGAATESAPTAGRISPLEARDLERIVTGGIAQEGLQRLTLPRATDVEGADRVRVVSARHGTTTVYKVLEVAPLGTFAVHRKLIVKEV